MKKIIAIALCVFMVLSMMTVSVFAEGNELMSDVYVSATGSDRAAGTVGAPTNSIVRAMSAVKDGGTIHIDGTIVVPEGLSFNKNISIVGDDKSTDILDLSAMPEGINLGGKTYFDGVTLKSSDYLIIAANGNTLVVGENCATSGEIGVYGGGYKVHVSDGGTNVTLLSGRYTEAYGGGHQGNVTGDTHITVGGSASVFNDANEGEVATNLYVMKSNIFGAGFGGNVDGSTYVVLSGDANQATFPKDFSESNHSSSLHYVFGGGYNCKVTGSTNVRITGNATAHYVFGGMYGSSTFSSAESPIRGGSNVTMDGGRIYGIYGASSGYDQGSSANVIMLGGTVSQIIGASHVSNHTGNVNIKLLGGKITRRVFGGCYNDASGLFTYTFESDYCVIGEGKSITVTVDSRADITINQNADNAFSAHSRRENNAGEVEAHIVFTSEEFKNTHTFKISVGDVSGGSAYDSISVQALLVGDVNLDGVVDENDAMAIFRYVFDKDAYALLDSSLADANADGKVTNADVLHILKGN